MKLHRYFIGEVDLADTLQLSDAELLNQWTRVLRYAPGREVRLFNADKREALYQISAISNKNAQLNKVKELEAQIPKNVLYLYFSLLKKDKNEWILQKATELGVTHFMPLLTMRTEKTGWNMQRTKKIVTEAAEQCGRTDIPIVFEPASIESALHILPQNVAVFVAEQYSTQTSSINPHTSTAVLVGPEGGWSDEEKALFREKNIQHIVLSEFTLRAETAAITASAILGAAQ